MNGDYGPFTAAVLAETFLAHGDLGVIGLDSAGRVALWNDWIAGRTGVTPAAATGRLLTELFDPPPTSLWTVAQAVLAQGQPRVLSPVLHADWLPFAAPTRQLIRLLPICTETHDVAGLLLLISDVTESLRYEEQTEAKLRESEARYRLLVDTSPYAIGVHQDGRLVFVNPAAVRILRARSAQDLIGKPISEIVHPDTWTAARERIGRMLAGETGLYPTEDRYLRLDGSEMPVEVTAAPFIYEGRPAVQVIALDITERKRAEEAERRQHNNLAALLDISQALTATLDLPTVLQLIVERSCRLTGLDSGAIYLLAGAELYLAATTPPLPPELPEAFRRAPLCDHPHIQQALAMDCPIAVPDAATADWSPAERAICEARGLRSLLYLPLTIEKRAVGVLILGAVGRNRSFHDDEIALYRTLSTQAALVIENARLYEQAQHQAAELEQRVAERTAELSERVAQVEQLNRAMTDLLAELQAANRQATETAERLRAVNAELEAFTYSVSHDLKAPLRGIDGYSRLLEEDYQDRLDADGRRFLSNIRRAAGQMNQLIDDLLAYSRLERRAIVKAPVDVAALVAALVAERAEEVRARGVRLTVEVSCAPVIAEAEGLTQALRNLLDNALKFTRNTPDAAITIGSQETTDSCILWVADNGPGFDAKYSERIFEIFQRLHRQEDYSGTGIGLAIVRKAMERMGGRAWAVSEPDRGATFYLEIPK